LPGAWRVARKQGQLSPYLHKKRVLSSIYSPVPAGSHKVSDGRIRPKMGDSACASARMRGKPLSRDRPIVPLESSPEGGSGLAN
jgi:hypothetical protein